MDTFSLLNALRLFLVFDTLAGTGFTQFELFILENNV